MTRVKICGITRLQDAVYAVDSGASALGFIFYNKSKRYIPPDDARDIIRKLPPFISLVGVFVNAPADDINSTISKSGINTLQLHGDETAEFCNNFVLPTIKTIRIADNLNLKHIESFDVQAILFDTFKENEYGGTGSVFNWDILENSGITKKIIISGGLNPENVQDAILKFNPYAVDVNSGVERSPGIKDHQEINKFIEAVNNA